MKRMNISWKVLLEYLPKPRASLPLNIHPTDTVLRPTHTDTHISFRLSLLQHYVRLSFFNPAVKHEWKKTSRCGDEEDYDTARCRCTRL